MTQEVLVPTEVCATCPCGYARGERHRNRATVLFVGQATFEIILF